MLWPTWRRKGEKTKLLVLFVTSLRLYKMFLCIFQIGTNSTGTLRMTSKQILSKIFGVWTHNFDSFSRSSGPRLHLDKNAISKEILVDQTWRPKRVKCC